MAEPEKKKFSFDRLDKIQEGLYAREENADTPAVGPKINVSTPDHSDVPSDWKEEVPEHLADAPERTGFLSTPLMKKILFAAGGFFVISIIFAAYVFFGGLNRVSTDKVNIVINGPSTIGAGEPLSFDITVQNDNNTALEGAKLLIDYPEGTRSADEGRADLPRELEELGTIGNGQSVDRTKQAIIFGEADSPQHIIISVEYRVKDSSATYYKEQYYDLLISTAPVRMTINAVEESVSGNEVEFSVEIVSNSTTIVKGLMLKVDYPFGFQFSTASPSPSFGNNVFVIGDLQPADRRVLRIRGKVSGQEGESRLFRFNLGLPDKQDARLIGTTFLSSSHPIAIKRPFVSASLSLDGSTVDVYTVPPGQEVHGEIAWVNNLDTRIADLEIKAKLVGNPLNRLSISADGGGYYRSLDDTIIWDKSISQQYAVIEPGESGVASFSFASLPLSSLMYSGLQGNEMSIEISVNARRLSGTNIPEQIVTGLSKKVRISSNVALSGRSLYFTGPFTNQGPIPPQADRSTTYTLVWSLTNTLNSASSVRVSAILPAYVTWLGNVSSGESVDYDVATRQVTWDAGDLPAGTGFSTSPREVFFQVSAIPSLSQRGQRISLIGDSVMTGVDRYSNASLRATIKFLTTQIEDAPAGMIDPGKVVQ